MLATLKGHFYNLLIIVAIAVPAYFIVEFVKQLMKPTIKTVSTKPGTVFTDCKDCPEMIIVPKGQFKRTDIKDNIFSNKDETLVTLKRNFAVGRYEITIGQFASFVQDSGYRVENECSVASNNGRLKKETHFSWKRPDQQVKDNHPVTCITVADASAYTDWLSKQTGKFYRLLTEAEWEYVARAGHTGPTIHGYSETNVCLYGNIAGNETGIPYKNTSCSDNYVKLSPVGSFRPNDFGVYDMLGNVWEHVADCFDESYPGMPSDGSAFGIESKCIKHIRRGNAWNGSYSSARGVSDYNERVNYSGFRVARSVSQNLI